MKNENPVAVTDTISAREYLVRWMRTNFPTDKTFADYIGISLAGDFACQLASALARQEQAAAADAQRHLEAAQKAREALGKALEADDLMSKMPHWGGVHSDMESEMRTIRRALDVFEALFPVLLPSAQSADQQQLASAN
ncbi:hypothetical protein [Massilia alkalitolerans]|uniref:hypothetical protein n=1 Tax=Massilia alkalitolerans TaxID=286638 RepID=UPI0004812552|nr:hypothetical protein [Massilia alkalitolerans]